MQTKEQEQTIKEIMHDCVSKHGEKVCNRLYSVAIYEELKQAEVSRVLKLGKYTVRYWVRRMRKFFKARPIE